MPERTVGGTLQSETTTTAIIAIVVAAVALLVAVAAIRIVREYERVVVFRLGRLRGQRGPGLVLIIPLLERTRPRWPARPRPSASAAPR